MAITTGSDRLFVESLGTLTVGLGEGDDLYVIDGSGTGANSKITINDSGVNRVQLTGGLTIKSSLVASNTTVLTLSNGAEITISNAAAYSYIIGGTIGTGTGGTTQTYTQFATTTLGATAVPAVGATAVAGTVNKAIVDPATPVVPVVVVPTFSIAAGAASVTEAGNATFTVTLSAAQATATTVNYTLAGTGTPAATVGTDTGTVAVTGTGVTSTATTLTFAAGSTTATITVPVTLDATTETGEGLSLTLTAPSTGTSLGANAVALTALADPAAPTFTMTSSAVAGISTLEGSTITFTVTPSGVVTTSTVLNLNIVGAALGAISATTDASDFTTAAAMTFAVGDTAAKTFTVMATSDGVTEGIEAYKAQLLDSGFAERGVVTGTLNDVSATISTSIFPLTAGLDNGTAFTGGAGNDIFNATHLTLNVSDVLDGGLGADTLSIVDSGTAALAIPLATVTGIETINVRNINSGTVAATTEVATITIQALNPGETLILAGRTVTAGASGATAADVATVLASSTVGATAGGATGSVAAVTGYTAAIAGGNGNVVTLTSTTPNSNVADLVVTGTALTGISQVQTITLVSTGGNIVAGDTYTFTYNGTSLTTAAISGADAAARLLSSSAVVAARINAFAGSTIATAANLGVVTVTSPTSIAFGTVVNNTAAGTSTSAFATTTALALPAPPTVVITQGSTGAGFTDTLVASGYVGATNFNSDKSTSGLTITALAAGQQVGIIGDTATANGALNFTYASTVTSGTINVAGGTTAGVVTETGAGITSNIMSSTGAANVLTNVVLSGTANTALTINAATNLTTGNITGFTGTTSTITVAGAAASVTLGTIENTTVKTIDASGLTAGGVTATLSTNTGIVFVGGAGNDIITAGAVLTTGASVNAGAGTADRIVFTANGQLTAASGALYTNFEVLQATGTTDINMNNITGITALRTSGNATFTNVTATQAANITTTTSGPLDIGVLNASTIGQLDSVSITASSTNVAVAIATLAAASVETINLIASTGTALTSITTLAHVAGGWSTLNLSGASAITVTTTNTNALANTSINATNATGIVTIDATLTATNGIAITGGSANDILTGSALPDVIGGGAGNDVIRGLAGADVLTGGAGNDIFAILSLATTQTGGGVWAAGNTTPANIDWIKDFVGNGAAAGDTIQLGIGTNVFMAGADFTTTTTTVVPVTVATAADFTTLAAAVQLASAGVASSAVAAQIYDVTVTAGTMVGRYVIINDNTAGIASTDTFIQVTGATGALNAQDFTYVA